MIPQGTTIAFRTSGFSAALVGVVIEFGRGEYDASSYEDLAAVMRAEDLSMAEVTLDLHFDPEQVPLIDQPAEVIEIEWPKGASQSRGPVWRFTGYATAVDNRSDLGAVMSASIGLQVTGPVVMLPGRRILRIAPSGQGSYASATDAERRLYGWIADAGTGQMPNGDDAYVIAERA